MNTPLSALAAFRLGVALSFAQALRRHLRLRMLLIGTASLALLVAVQVVMVLANRHIQAGVDAYVVFTGITVLNLVLPFVSLITALGLLGGELEQGTLVYLLIRPCPRLAILLGRTLAAAFATALVVALMFFACLAAVRVVGGDRPPLPSIALGVHLTLIGAFGAWTFTALYTALTLFVKRPLVALLLGVFHALIWEGIIAFMPGNIGGYTFSQNLHALFFDHPEVRAWPRQVLFRDIRAVPQDLDAIVFLGAVSLLALALAWYRFRGREFSSAE